VTTATLAATTTVDALNHKKRFAQVLDARDTARTLGDKVLAAPKAARDGLMSVLRALHVDTAAQAAFGLIKRVYSTAASTLARGWRLGTSVFGWKVPLLYALTDEDARGWLGKALAWTYLGTCAVIYRTGTLVSKVPFVGKPIVQVMAYPVLFADRMANLGFEHGAKLVDRYKDSFPVKAIHAFTGGVMVGRLIRAIVPARFRWIAWVAVLLRPTKAAIGAVRNDPAAGEVGEQIDRVVNVAKAATAAATDVVVDRVLDGPRGDMKTTQPGTETVDIIEVATGKRTTVTVEIDSRNDKRVFWDGQYYDLPDLGQADTDPIRLLPIDPATKAMQLDARRKEVEERNAADIAAMAPATPATPAQSRPVARAMAASTPRKAGARAKAGRR
jgi:hypothetical protein